MKTKFKLVGAAVLLAAMGVHAGTAAFNLNQTAPNFWAADYDSDFLVGYLLGGAPFVAGTDTLTFDDFMLPMPVGMYNVQLTFHELAKDGLPVVDPIHVSASTNLNGVPITFATTRTFTIDGTAPHPFVLNLDGWAQHADVGYHGTITVTPVPEPKSYAMLLAGLGIMGAIARRRNIRNS